MVFEEDEDWEEGEDEEWEEEEWQSSREDRAFYIFLFYKIVALLLLVAFSGPCL